MIPHQLRPASPQTHLAAFSLIEIALSLAIIATAMLAVLGILPAGLDASKRAVDSTVVANILDSLHHRLQGEALAGTSAQSIFAKPSLFDAQGVLISEDVPEKDRPQIVYRADLSINDFRDRPADTGSLRAVTIALSWPVDSRSGNIPAGVKPRSVVSYPVTTLTGPDWIEISKSYTSDPTFTQKIGF